MADQAELLEGIARAAERRMVAEEELNAARARLADNADPLKAVTRAGARRILAEQQITYARARLADSISEARERGHSLREIAEAAGISAEAVRVILTERRR
jgi:hypothetical protein